MWRKRSDLSAATSTRSVSSWELICSPCANLTEQAKARRARRRSQRFARAFREGNGFVAIERARAQDDPPASHRQELPQTDSRLDPKRPLGVRSSRDARNTQSSLAP